MGHIHLVRHGQASFGAANYDQLSTLGEQQAQALGRHWLRTGQRFDAVLTGTLARHRQTLQNIAQGMNFECFSAKSAGNAGFLATEAIANAPHTPALNEYDSEALIQAQLAVAPQDLPPATSPEGYRAHFAVLRTALKAWIAGELQPAGMPSFAHFRLGLAQVLQELAQDPAREVLVVSSGGPISTVVMHLLSSPATTMIDLNYQLHNSAVTRLVMVPKGGKCLVSSFNTLPHFDALPLEELKRWRTST
jgi:broad specificity phosphatase PhoE